MSPTRHRSVPNSFIQHTHEKESCLTCLSQWSVMFGMLHTWYHVLVWQLAYRQQDELLSSTPGLKLGTDLVVKPPHLQDAARTTNKLPQVMSCSKGSQSLRQCRCMGSCQPALVAGWHSSPVFAKPQSFLCKAFGMHRTDNRHKTVR